MTPNQIVGYRLALARKLRGWTQEQAVEQLERHLGVRWSSVVLSAAERSSTNERVRKFNADEIVGFSKAFEIPVAWFFLPPSILEGRAWRQVVETELAERLHEVAGEAALTSASGEGR